MVSAAPPTKNRTMKIKTTRNVRVGKAVHLAGKVIDVSEKDAAFLIGIGKAEPASEEKPEKKGGA